MTDARTLIIFLPFLGAALVGLSYALNEKAFTAVNAQTFLWIYCTVGSLGLLLLHFLSPLKIDLSVFAKAPVAWLLLISVPISMVAWTITVVAIRHISANYTALGEITYPLFTIFFCALLSGKQVDWTMGIGAALILSGSFLLINHQLAAGK